MSRIKVALDTSNTVDLNRLLSEDCTRGRKSVLTTAEKDFVKERIIEAAE